ncbi:DNA directed RNA polymerases I and III subunit [Echinococcus multilocularis]|uniref:DNA directed RNA polymerases I and III subunit n=1 Tax=Echinococcus multilocularis TaxID=6211 RepID=A0A068Y929_ECHMU|nr:DNA directed RNA polymerases I and III subunit [Echinococcus multilocularis]
MTDKFSPSIAVKQHGLSFIPSAPQKWDVDIFISEFQVVVTSFTPETIEFDMISIDCTFANSIRRILVSEVPSFAIDRVYLYQNTSVIADETFCHRLGLVPLNVDPDKMSFCSTDLPDIDDLNGFDPNSHLVFDLSVKAERPSSKGNSDSQPKESFQSFPLYSSSLTWVPLPGQEDAFKNEGASYPAPVSRKVLLNKLGPGDEIMARCLAVKGVGRDHAKFSPVSAAFYKLLPSIEINGVVRGDLARKLQRSFAKGVIDVDPRTQVASVADARLDNGSREHLRHPDLASIVHVFLNPRHFIFTVESIAPGYRPPDMLVKSAIDVMLSKCAHYLTIVEKPGFAASPLSDPNVEIGGGELPGEEAAKTSLNGRAVGLDVAFVSNDLRRATFRFTGEDHTLGAPLRYCILRSEAVKLCGYCQPHPLEDSITFEIQSKDEMAVTILRNGLYCLRACFEHIKRKFKSAMKKAQKQASKSTPD